MPDYGAMDAAELQAEYAALQKEYQAFVQRGLKLDMSRGKPAPNQLDLSMDLLKMDDYLDESGLDTRNYGTLEGCPEARAFFADILGAEKEETIVAGNSSLSLMYNLVDLGWRFGFSGQTPWGQQGRVKFLCPSPGYDRHFRVSEEFGFELITVPMTPDGPDMEVVERLAQDESVKGIWCIPIYSNPDGYVYSAQTVDRLARMKAAPDFRIFWDNAYGVHNFEGPLATCPSLLKACREAGHEDRALMLCSTSKMTFAGAGVCAFAASKQNVDALLKFVFTMTICFDKVNQLRHVRFFKRQGGITAHMQKHADLIRPKFNQVYEILHLGLDGYGPIASWTQPQGGYFFSLNTMEGCAKRTVALCKEAGVVLTGAGAAFPYGNDPRDRHLRIAPTFPSLDELKTAAELLCIAVRLACVEKLLDR